MRGEGTLAAVRREMAEARAARSVTGLFEHKILGNVARTLWSAKQIRRLLDFMIHDAVALPAVTRARAPAPHTGMNITPLWWLRSSTFPIDSG